MCMQGKVYYKKLGAFYANTLAHQCFIISRVFQWPTQAAAALFLSSVAAAAAADGAGVICTTALSNPANFIAEGQHQILQIKVNYMYGYSSNACRASYVLCNVVCSRTL